MNRVNWHAVAMVLSALMSASLVWAIGAWLHWLLKGGAR